MATSHRHLGVAGAKIAVNVDAVVDVIGVVVNIALNVDAVVVDGIG